MHLVGFIIKEFVTMHGHMNVNFGRTVRIPVKDGCMGLSSAVTAPASKVVLRLFCPRLKIVNHTGLATAVVAVRTRKVTADL